MLEGKALLDGQAPFTYMLCDGLDRYHYLLYYVGADRKVHFKNVRILYLNGVTIYRNGGDNTYETIENLVPGCIRCSSTICKPLV